MGWNHQPDQLHPQQTNTSPEKRDYFKSKYRSSNHWIFRGHSLVVQGVEVRWNLTPHFFFGEISPQWKRFKMPFVAVITPEKRKIIDSQVVGMGYARYVRSQESIIFSPSGLQNDWSKILKLGLPKTLLETNGCHLNAGIGSDEFPSFLSFWEGADNCKLIGLSRSVIF